MAIINSVIVSGGIQPSGTKNITSNGVHDVSAYASADVQVPTTAPALYREFQLDNTGRLVTNTTTTAIMNFTGVTDVSDYILYKAYNNNRAISGVVDMSDLTRINGSYGCNSMFLDCTGLTSVDMSSLTTVSGSNCCQSMFQGCTGLTSVDISSLTTVSWGNCCNTMFSGCTGLTSVDMSSLTIVSGGSGCGYMFSGCTGLTSVDISSLTTVNASQCCSGMFQSCTNLTSLSFPSITSNSFGSYTNQFGNMCYRVSNVTLHFPSNTQAKIETLQGYSTTAPFGATAGTVLFDLPATNTLTGADSVTYTRNPKYDTATALAWKVGAYGTSNFTPAYYTSGTTDPAVSDTIYSDAACTTAVTTISTIA